MYINWFTWIIFIHDSICYTKTEVNENYLDSLNVMVNYYYHGENRVITRQPPSMATTSNSDEGGGPIRSIYRPKKDYGVLDWEYGVRMWTKFLLRKYWEGLTMVASVGRY